MGGGGSNSDGFSLPRHSNNGLKSRYGGQGGGRGGVFITKSSSLILSTETASTINVNHEELSAHGIGADGNGSVYRIHTPSHLKQGSQFDKPIIVPEDEIIDFTTPPGQQKNMYQYTQNDYTSNNISNQH